MQSTFIGEFNLNDGHFRYQTSGGVTVYCNKEAGQLCLVTGILIPGGKNAAKTLLDCYGRHKEKVSGELSGQYTFVVVDCSNRKLVFGQDVFGLSAGFYSRNAATIIVSNKLGLLARENSVCELDHEYLADYLELGEPVSRKTPYKGIHRLCFGETILADGKNTSSYHPSTTLFRDSPVSYSQDVLEEEFREHLSNAVNMGGDSCYKNIWCEVSGGLDSTSVFYLKKQFDQSITPVSIISRSDNDGGDTAMLKTIFEQQSDWRYFPGEDFSPFSVLPHSTIIDEPGSEVFFASQLHFNSMMEENKVDLLMTGFGGDLVLGGQDCSPYFLADLLWNRSLPALRQEIKGFVKMSSQSRKFPYWLYHYAIRVMFSYIMKSRVVSPGQIETTPGWINTKFKKEYNTGKRWQCLGMPGINAPGKNAIFQELLLSCAAESVSFSSHLSCPVYHPLLFKPLVQFMLDLPYEYRMNAHEDRILQRKALAGIVPKAILERSDKGTLQLLFDESYKTNKEWQSRLAGYSMLVELGIFDKMKWNETLDRARFGLFSSLKHFIAAISLEIWLQNNFGDKQNRATPVTRVPCL